MSAPSVLCHETETSSSGRETSRGRLRGRRGGRGRQFSSQHQYRESEAGASTTREEEHQGNHYSHLREGWRGGRCSRRGHRWHAGQPAQAHSLNPNAAEYQPSHNQRHWQAWSPQQQQGVSHDTGQDSSRRGAEARDDVEYSESCVICCEDLKVAMVGHCNHKDICANCGLRMRICYDKMACPLCKAELKEVVMTPWRPEGVPDWTNLQRDMHHMWTNLSWVRGVFVDNRQVEGLAKRRRPLSSELEARTGRTCSICDPAADRVFPSNRSLMRHMELEHSKFLCKVCIAAHRQFPSELEAYTSQGLVQHMASHPKCEFCKLHHFGHDELYEHMRAAHFMCYVCQQLGRLSYFASPEVYTTHLREDHYLCDELDCRDCFVAFATPEELEMHRQVVHMRPRSLRHPNALDFFSPPAGFNLPRAPRARGEVRSMPQPPAPGRRPHQRGRGTHRTGLRMIDDDLGMTGEPFPALHDAAPAATSAASDDERENSELDAFPESASRLEGHMGEADPATADGRQAPQLRRNPSVGTASQGPQRLRHPRLPRLVSVARRCLCGRRRDHPVIPEGSDPGLLPCDAACERRQRWEQLASAFDIPDADRHRPVAERTRIVAYSPELLFYAWHNVRWVEDVERVMVAFVESTAQRHRLPPMPRPQRKVVHEMAAAFGLTSQSIGHDPERQLQLFKGSEPVIPRNLLSKAAAALTLEEVTAKMKASQGHALHLTDVAPGTDLASLFGRWEGGFTLLGPCSDGRAVVRFTTEAHLQEAVAAFGGGLRGAFLIERRPARPPSDTEAGGVPSEVSAGPSRATGMNGSATVGAEDSWQPVVRSARHLSIARDPEHDRQVQQLQPFAALSGAAEPLEDWEEQHAPGQSDES